jgi:hypothetical protein
MGISKVALIALVASALLGCGGRSTHTPASTSRTTLVRSDATCRHQTRLILDEAHEILRHYGAQAPGPADVAYFGFQDALSGFQSHGCRPQILGRALTRRLTKEQQTALFSHLPAVMVRYLEWTLTCGRRRAISVCTEMPPYLKTISPSNPSGNRYPLKP